MLVCIILVVLLLVSQPGDESCVEIVEKAEENSFKYVNASIYKYSLGNLSFMMVIEIYLFMKLFHPVEDTFTQLLTYCKYCLIQRYESLN